MPSVLKPDLKAIIWLGIGFVLAPKLVALVMSKRG